MFAWIKSKWAELTTKLGSLLSVLALAWPQIQQKMPDVVKQLGEEYPGPAKTINAAVAIIGIALIVYREKPRV